MQQKNLDIYGNEPIPWSRAVEQLETDAPRSFWLTTVRPDGRPPGVKPCSTVCLALFLNKTRWP